MKLISVDSGGFLNTEDYSCETPSTSFAETIALIHAAALDEFLIDDLEMMTCRKSDNNQIHQYLSAAKILASPDSPAALTAIISLSRPSDIYILNRQ